MRWIHEIVRQIWWIAPFVFVFSFMAAMKENNENGQNNIRYGIIAAISLLVIVAVFKK